MPLIPRTHLGSINQDTLTSRRLDLLHWHLDLFHIALSRCVDLRHIHYRYGTVHKCKSDLFLENYCNTEFSSHPSSIQHTHSGWLSMSCDWPLVILMFSLSSSDAGYRSFEAHAGKVQHSQVRLHIDSCCFPVMALFRTLFRVGCKRECFEYSMLWPSTCIFSLKAPSLSRWSTSPICRF